MAGGPEDHFTDSRELYVLVEGDEWAHMDALDPDAERSRLRAVRGHGGDIGAQVVPWIAAAYPERLTDLHLNWLPRLPVGERPDGFTDEEARYAVELEEWLREGTGYQAIQGTRPQTLAYGLTDSPVGLARVLDRREAAGLETERL